MAESNRQRGVCGIGSLKADKGAGPFPTRPENITRVTLWVVDWDIPAGDKAARQRFYRRLRYIWLNYYGDTRMSTMSVLITDEEDLAREVYRLASKFGRANLYEARRLEP